MSCHGTVSAPNVAHDVQHDPRAHSIELYRQFGQMVQAAAHSTLAFWGADDEQKPAAAGTSQLHTGRARPERLSTA